MKLNVGVDIGAGSGKFAAPLDQVPGWTGAVIDDYAVVEGIPTQADFRETGASIYRLIDENFGTPTSIAVGCFGPLDLHAKTILNAPNLHGWIGQSFREWEELFQLPIILDNDANCAAYAEAIKGTGRLSRVVSCWTLGSGIGNGLIIDKMIHHGVWDPEGGHICLDPDGPLCGCGQRGCLEAYISTQALRNKYHAEPKELAGNEAVWDYYAHYLGWGCQILAMTVNPEIIVLCGGIAKQPGLLEKVRGRFSSMVKVYPKEAVLPRIVIGEFLSSAGIIGAVELARAS